ncbi:glucuronate isomerase [Halobacillus litoralis]|uniref:Uronate isomerase n=1 Tax=Halobacillus litoralis TaxID=45668 RepID=A0A410MC08_9BACI|nr:glucuronate isomerase [Halobacillus litoralis]QAS52186.1 glucuronate isomerase [Halobacillus litoralis]
MKNFMDETFLLNTETAERLYNNYAKDMPIIDYHCHLSPKEIYENKSYKTIADIWLDGDHYKWRLMRANGIDENLITGDAEPYEKFLAWARTVPKSIGNPVYTWTHLELQRYFNIYVALNEDTAPEIWDRVNEQLNQKDFGVRDLIKASNVEVICTTDDPVDDLRYHKQLKESDFETEVLPSFRPDKGLELNRDGYQEWVSKLEETSQVSINSYEDFLAALDARARFFNEIGGKISDHALDEVVYEETTMEEVSNIFKKARSGFKVSKEEEVKYKSFTLTFLGKIYAELGWVMQYHISAQRNNNTKMFQRLGPDTGFDSMNDGQIAKPLCRLLDALEQQDALPKTVLYSLNPKDNPVLATIAGSFQEGGVPGKMQFGTAWWFNDTKEGMLAQMKTLADMGVLSSFIGMLTDSRSFLSYTRHEYFRRVLCDLLATWVENGEVPNDDELLEPIIKDVSYRNAAQYLGFRKKPQHLKV